MKTMNNKTDPGVNDTVTQMSAAEEVYYREWLSFLVTDGLQQLFESDKPAPVEKTIDAGKKCVVAETLYKQGRCIECFEYSLDGVTFACFRFRLNGTIYTWHQPAKDVPFEYATTSGTPANKGD